MPPNKGHTFTSGKKININVRHLCLFPYIQMQIYLIWQTGHKNSTPSVQFIVPPAKKR